MTPAQYNEYQRQADVIEQAKKWEEEQKNKQMTSIEYLVKEFSKYYAIHQLEDEIEKAKKMHKQEIMRAFIDGEENVWDRKNEGHEFQYDNHEHYYTEKFKKD
jgi:membrane protein involved in colicin uptake